MIVRLTMIECILANAVGCKRQSEARNRPDANGFRGNGRMIHALGAAGELAAAKALGVPWFPTCNAGKGPDLAPDWQVRTRTRANYDLIVRANDKPEERYVLILAHDYPRMDVVGWCWGHEARQDKWARDHGGRPTAWFVPRRALQPI